MFSFTNSKGTMRRLTCQRNAFGRKSLLRIQAGATAMDYLAAMRAFVRVVELGSFSRVAAESGARISTVSRYISQLEADLGAALFNRSTRHLHLTEAGQSFYDRATRIVAAIEDARAATRSLNGRPQGLLRINIPNSFGRRHVMPHMKDFLAAYPDIRLDATLTEATVDLIQAGADVAIRIGALADSGLVAKKMASQRRVLVTSQEYLALRGAPREPTDLSSHECLTFALQPTKAWYYCSADASDSKLSEVEVDGHLRANDAEMLHTAVLSGQGIAMLPTWLVGDDVRGGRLIGILSQWEWRMAPGPSPAIWAIYPPKKLVSPKVKSFIAFLTSRIGTPPYWDS
jgi:DNA-binding transcriptional LysR family regulator